MNLHAFCPRCRQEYIIDDADGQEAICPGCGSEWACNMDAEPEEEPILEFDPGIAATPMEPSTDAWQPITKSPRRRRRESSLAAKIIPPILGGLTAIPISLAILWYGFGRDIGNLAPTIARYVPWIVPEELQGSSRRRASASDRSRGLSSPKRNSRDRSSRSQGDPDRDANSNGQSDAQQSPKSELSDRMASFANLMLPQRELWDEEPLQSWSEVQRMVYRETCGLARAWTDSNELWPAAPPYALEDLIQQDWFRDAIAQWASAQAPGAHPPEAFDPIAWPVDAIDFRSPKLFAPRIEISPPLTIDSRPVVWTWSSTVADRLRAYAKGRDQKRALLLGQVERADELGYVIRIDALIP